MELSYLYNLDESRGLQDLVTEVVRVPAYSEEHPDFLLRVSLKHIPKAGTLTVTRDGAPLTILSDGSMPTNNNAVAIDYRSEYDYVAAKGILIFYLTAQNLEFTVSYVPVASRVDALILNKLIRIGRHAIGDESPADHADGEKFNFWTKDELLNKANKNIIEWTAIANKPVTVQANSGESGLMSPSDKMKLDGVKDPVSNWPVSSVVCGTSGQTVKADSWGGKITIDESDTITPEIGKDGNSLKLNVRVANVVAGITDYTDALRSTTELTCPPSATNRFVTDKDPRMTNKRNPTAHNHTMSDITGLSAALDTRAPSTHSHLLQDIIDLTHENFKGTDGKSASINSVTINMLDPGAAPYVENNGTELNAELVLNIPRGEKGDKGDQGAPFEYWMFTETQKDSLRGPQGPKGDKGDVPTNVITTEELYGSWTKDGMHIIPVTSVSGATYFSKLDLMQGSLYANGYKYSYDTKAASALVTNITPTRFLVADEGNTHLVYNNGNLAELPSDTSRVELTLKKDPSSGEIIYDLVAIASTGFSKTNRHFNITNTNELQFYCPNYIPSTADLSSKLIFYVRTSGFVNVYFVDGVLECYGFISDPNTLQVGGRDTSSLLYPMAKLHVGAVPGLSNVTGVLDVTDIQVRYPVIKAQQQIADLVGARVQLLEIGENLWSQVATNKFEYTEATDRVPVGNLMVSVDDSEGNTLYYTPYTAASYRVYLGITNSVPRVVFTSDRKLDCYVLLAAPMCTDATTTGAVEQLENKLVAAESVIAGLQKTVADLSEQLSKLPVVVKDI